MKGIEDMSNDFSHRSVKSGGVTWSFALTRHLSPAPTVCTCNLFYVSETWGKVSIGAVHFELIAVDQDRIINNAVSVTGRLLNLSLSLFSLSLVSLCFSLSLSRFSMCVSLFLSLCVSLVSLSFLSLCISLSLSLSAVLFPQDVLTKLRVISSSISFCPKWA